ncbi:hypothetical protein CDAR_571291 [Caerostris darwini]|uniref:Uncharacterized protein n=1 Tax=Caerostris darwini TaxID=1538125 RepID=A0AAV4SN16_9ARAC|nr:hypothetical protein CDAR_571291 [Caerostris darwini]
MDETVSFAHEERSVKPSRPALIIASEYRKCVTTIKGTATTTASSSSSTKSVIGKTPQVVSCNRTLEWTSLWRNNTIDKSVQNLLHHMNEGGTHCVRGM